MDPYVELLSTFYLDLVSYAEQFFPRHVAIYVPGAVLFLVLFIFSLLLRCIVGLFCCRRSTPSSHKTSDEVASGEDLGDELSEGDAEEEEEEGEEIDNVFALPTSESLQRRWNLICSKVAEAAELQVLHTVLKVPEAEATGRAIVFVVRASDNLIVGNSLADLLPHLKPEARELATLRTEDLTNFQNELDHHFLSLATSESDSPDAQLTEDQLFSVSILPFAHWKIARAGSSYPMDEEDPNSDVIDMFLAETVVLDREEEEGPEDSPENRRKRWSLFVGRFKTRDVLVAVFANMFTVETQFVLSELIGHYACGMVFEFLKHEKKQFPLEIAEEE